MKNGIGLTVTIALTAVIAFMITACESEAGFGTIEGINASGLTIYGLKSYEGKEIKATASFTVNNTGVTLLASLPPVKNYYSLSGGRFDGTFTFTPGAKVTGSRAVMQVYKDYNQSDYPVYTGNDQNVCFHIYMLDRNNEVPLGAVIVSFSFGNAQGGFIDVDKNWVATPSDFVGSWSFTMPELNYTTLILNADKSWSIYFSSSNESVYGEYEIGVYVTLYRSEVYDDNKYIGQAQLITPTIMHLELPDYFSETYYYGTKN